MNLRRIFAVMERDLKFLSRSKGRIFDTFYFPLVWVLIWGFFTIYLKEFMLESALVLLAVNILWNFTARTQMEVNLHIMEDRWTESIKQIFSSPLRSSEYLIGKMVFSLVLSIVPFILVLLLSYFMFDFGFFFQDFVVFGLFVSIIIITSFAISTVVASAITMLGNEYSFLSWTSIQMFILVSAPFFPVSIYPSFIQPISKLVPYTHVFESIRSMSQGVLPSATHLLIILGVSFVYLVLSFPLYAFSVNRSRKNGKLVKIW